jgi:hypothetical protein
MLTKKNPKTRRRNGSIWGWELCSGDFELQWLDLDSKKARTLASFLINSLDYYAPEKQRRTTAHDWCVVKLKQLHISPFPKCFSMKKERKKDEYCSRWACVATQSIIIWWLHLFSPSINGDSSVSFARHHDLIHISARSADLWHQMLTLSDGDHWFHHNISLRST